MSKWGVSSNLYFAQILNIMESSVQKTFVVLLSRSLCHPRLTLLLPNNQTRNTATTDNRKLSGKRGRESRVRKYLIIKEEESVRRDDKDWKLNPTVWVTGLTMG